MDGLSGVASGMAVISLSLQLVQSIDTIRTKIKHVKGAPAEVERLSRLLGVLAALLDDVRQMLEYQSSCGDDTVPMPSLTIFDCMKGCEKVIEPLRQMIQEYEQREAESDSKIARLRMNTKFGFKVKDIAGIEERIQQEINRLNMALTINNTRQLHALHVFVGKQTCISRSINSVEEKPGAVESSAQVSTSNAGIGGTQLAARTFTRILSSSQQFGIWRQEMIHTKPRRRDTLRDPSRQVNQWETREEVYFWACRLLGTGIRWSRQHLCGTVIPSISTYPVVADFADFGHELYEIFVEGTVSDLEQVLQRGEVHPFTRDESGQSLLHKATYHSRWEFYECLEAYGFKADADYNGNYPMQVANIFFDTTFDVLQVGLQESRSVGYEFMSMFSQWTPPDMPIETLTWLWKNREELFYGEDISDLPYFCVQRHLHLLIGNQDQRIVDLVVEQLRVNFANTMRNWGSENLLRLFNEFFEYRPRTNREIHYTSYNGYEGGDMMLKTFQELKIDITAHLRTLIEDHSFDIIRFWDDDPPAKFDVGHTPGAGWRLGWKWDYDPRDPGYLLVSEFEGLAAEIKYAYGFPFHDVDPVWDRSWWRIYYTEGAEQQREREEQKKRRRFDRRCANKARKELARMGLKRPPSKMPGSWVE